MVLCVWQIKILLSWIHDYVVIFCMESESASCKKNNRFWLVTIVSDEKITSSISWIR